MNNIIKKGYRNLIETNVLHNLIMTKSPNLRILNTTWYLPTSTNNAQIEVFEKRIPSSFYFDIDKVIDTKSQFPHMLPTTDDFTAFMKEYRIRTTDQIICYDNVGVYTSPRVWWMLSSFGCQNVKVLNGGFPKWLKENRPVDSKFNTTYLPISEDKHDSYNYSLNNQQVVNYPNVCKLSKLIVNKQTQSQLVDARLNNRFNGIVPEPRPNVRRGHIPGAKNITFQDVLSEDGTTYLSLEKIKQLGVEKGIDTKYPIVFYCGSGVTACVPYLPFLELGATCSIYDGSWSEYGSFPEPEK